MVQLLLCRGSSLRADYERFRSVQHTPTVYPMGYNSFGGKWMPLYEYRCPDCGHEFEELVSFADADNVACQHCGSDNVERLMSGFCSGRSTSGDSGEVCLPSG